MKVEELISKWDVFLREGNIDGVKNSLFTLYSIKIERHHRQPIASLLRRAGCYNTGLKVLHPALFFKDRTERTDIKSWDLAEYALLISEIGIPQQAIQYFARVDAKQVPMKNLYMAFCFFKMWNYKEAEKYLIRYIGSIGISDYERLLGQINLLAAMIENDNLEKANQLLKTLRLSIMASENIRIKSNFLELEAQYFIKVGDLVKAESLLGEAEQLARKNMERDGLYIRKWLAYLQAKKTKSLQPLHSFSKEAQRFQEWESLRDCEFLKLKVSFDPKRFAQLFVGTPKPAYRNRLLNSFEILEPPKMAYLGKPNASDTVDVLQARFRDQEIFALGRPLHQMFYALCSDFYAAQPVGALFHSTFPEEYYDPNSSPNRIHQLIFRLREEFLRNNLGGVQVLEFDGTYSLQTDNKTLLRLELLDAKFSREAIMFKRLCSKDIPWPLRSKTVAESLQISKPTAVRYIRYWLSKGWLTKDGNGPETLYKVA